MEDLTVKFILISALVLIFIIIVIDIYFTIMGKKKINNIERSLKTKDEDMSKILESLRKLQESMEEVNKLKKEVNEIKVSRK